MKLWCLQSSTLTMAKCSSIGNLGMLMPKENLLYWRWYSLFLAHKDSCQEVTHLWGKKSLFYRILSSINHYSTPLSKWSIAPQSFWINLEEILSPCWFSSMCNTEVYNTKLDGQDGLIPQNVTILNLWLYESFPLKKNHI